MSPAHEVVNFVARHGMFYSIMKSRRVKPAVITWTTLCIRRLDILFVNIIRQGLVQMLLHLIKFILVSIRT